MGQEFKHYSNHKSGSDLQNCGACALENPQMIEYSDGARMGINYAGWPLSYIESGRRIPERFLPYLLEELKSDNEAYVANLRKHLHDAGYDLAGMDAKNAKG